MYVSRESFVGDAFSYVASPWSALYVSRQSIVGDAFSYVASLWSALYVSRQSFAGDTLSYAVMQRVYGVICMSVDKALQVIHSVM